MHVSSGPGLIQYGLRSPDLPSHATRGHGAHVRCSPWPLFTLCPAFLASHHVQALIAECNHTPIAHGCVAHLQPPVQASHSGEEAEGEQQPSAVQKPCGQRWMRP